MPPNHDAHMRPAAMPTGMRELALHVQLAAAIHVTLVGLDCANLRHMYKSPPASDSLCGLRSAPYPSRQTDSEPVADCSEAQACAPKSPLTTPCELVQ